VLMVAGGLVIGHSLGLSGEIRRALSARTTDPEWIGPRPSRYTGDLVDRQPDAGRYRTDRDTRRRALRAPGRPGPRAGRYRRAEALVHPSRCRSTTCARGKPARRYDLSGHPRNPIYDGVGVRR
jgi:hypothetical protein